MESIASSAEKLWKRGVDLRTARRYEEAIDAFEKAIELNPNNIMAWRDKADVLFFLERYEEALKAYDEVLKLDPSDENAAGNKKAIVYKKHNSPGPS